MERPSTWACVHNALDFFMLFTLVSFVQLSGYVSSGERAKGRENSNTKHPRELVKVLVTLEPGRSNNVVITPDGKKVIGTHTVWDAETGKVLTKIKVFRRHDFKVAITPDGKKAVTTVGKGFPAVWDVETGKVLKVLSTRGGYLSLAITSDGKTVISYKDRLERFVFWDISTGKEIGRTVPIVASPFAIAVTPDGNKMIFQAHVPGTARGLTTFQVHDIPTRRFLKRFTVKTHMRPAESFTHLALDGAAKRLICGYHTGFFIIEYPKTARIVKHVQLDETKKAGVAGLQVLKDGKTVVSGVYCPTKEQVKAIEEGGFRGSSQRRLPYKKRRQGDLRITFWDIATGKELRTIKIPGGGGPFCVFPDGKKIVCHSQPENIFKVWDISER